MTYHLGVKVRIKDTAFAESDDPKDANYRGQIGRLVTDWNDVFGPDWHGYWEVELVDGERTLVKEDEIEPAQD